MNKKLIRIAKYLANNGLYKEASEIKKVAEFWDDIDTHKEILKDSVEAVLGELKNLKLSISSDDVDRKNLHDWTEKLSKETTSRGSTSTWGFDPDPRQGTFVQDLPRGGYLLQTNLICEDETSNFFGCTVQITTNTMREKTRVIIGFPDQDQAELP